MSGATKRCFSHRRTAFFPLLFFISVCNHVGRATDSLSPGQSLTGEQTIVSKGGDFELGFFSPGKPPNYYIGIWYKKIPKQTVVWVANRGAPVSNSSSSELTISKNGDLVLLNHSKIPVWSSNGSISSATGSFVAVLLDTGNLVLREQSNSSAVIWQSFDQPTDTWLPEGWVGFNKVTGQYMYLHSWRNAEDPAPGRFSYHIDEGGSNQFFLRWNGSKAYWTTGEWTGQFSKMPEVNSSRHFTFSYADDGQRKGYTYTVHSRDFLFTRGTLDPSGRISLYVWLQNAEDWQQVWVKPTSPCDVYAVCGAFGVCNDRGRICECLRGFKPANERDWELGDWSDGCVRTDPHCCGCRGEDGFLAMPGIRVPNNYQALAVRSREECELACSEDCNCTAYAYGGGCSVWTDELRNAQRLNDGDSDAQALYVRVASSELSSSINGNRRAYGYWFIIATVIGVVILISAALGLIWRFYRRRYHASKLAEGPLITFTYAKLKHITNNFIEKLGGGGFGSVFRGTLPDSTPVAVKRLEGSIQGEKQFRTEVTTLGTIHHVNLVRLHGFCAEGTKKLLVYEHMPNGSLDAHLFGSCKVLDWNVRYQIIVGIAKGLAYLHERCLESIIHCDVKPENILLDADFQPKVSDFGLAKLLGRDFSRVLTTMRGTIGYLAPEWISGLPITTKADVFSYGMLVLEIISGRRNTEKHVSGSIKYFPLWAAIKMNEGEVLCLLDEKLKGVADAEQLTTVCRVACWCVQDYEDCRPSMSQVVQILEGALEVNIPSVPNSFRQFIEEDEPTSVSPSQNSSTTRSSQTPCNALG